MDLSYLEFYTYRYATTNPPINESSSLILEADGSGGATLIKKSNYNQDEWCAKYSVTAAQFDEIKSLFESLGVKEELLRIMAVPPAPPVEMMGGSNGSGFVCKADGEELSIRDSVPCTQELGNRINRLLNECGEPFYKTEPEQSGNNGCFFATVQVAQAAPAPPPNDFEASWYCPNCGYPNQGSFCTECGTVRP